ncbi:MAG: hypothetical protein CMQ41_08870 [Gammaproteobacteria bacterium]|nr:hypothetical protein [Gammaproteobacteria bacterium]|tara:strand:- start:861 stop:1598 length:738 start_codon:yes stop_codon:yes gene_type:complete
MKTYSENSTKTLFSKAHKDPCNHIEDIQERISDSPSIEQLINRNANVWRGCDMADQLAHAQSTGYPEFDNILPGKGWPQNGLVEIISSNWGMGELQLLIPLMRSIVQQSQWILGVSPPHLLYAPALIQAGINISQVLIVGLDTSCKDALWVIEKALQTQNCGLVLTWQNWLPNKVLRRLQLAAEAGNTLGVIFKHADNKNSPSRLRLQIRNSSPHNAVFNIVDITVIKARGNFQPLTTKLKIYQN